MGKTIGIFASAGVVGDRESAKNAQAKLEREGYRIKCAPSVFASEGLFPGDGKTLAGEFMDLYMDRDVDMLLAVKGGYGSSRILEHLDYKTLAANPKKVCGYSDVTALIAALNEKAGLSALHGPMIVSMDSDMTERSYRQLLDRLEEPYGREEQDFFKGYSFSDGDRPAVLVPGKAEGILKGGNLCVFTSLLGTPYEADCSGAVLFLEDIHEEPYRVHRMMNQLKMSGALDRAAGFLIGQFTKCEQPEGEMRFQPKVPEIMEEFLLPLGKPVLKNLPSGHISDNMTLIMGKKVSLDLGKVDFEVKYL